MTKILIIEDDSGVLETLCMMLEDAGYTTIGANDRAEGVRAFAQSRPDLVITDIIMPGRDGIETMREIVSLDPDAKIIAVSGGAKISKDYYLRMAKSLGATALIEKPFRIEELCGVIETCLRAPATSREHTFGK